MSLLFFGKLLVAIGICFQAYTLFESKSAATTFDNRLNTVLAACNCIPADIQQHIKAHLRLVVVGLLAFSGLMVFVRSCFVKVPVLLGLLIVFLVRYYPLAVPNFTTFKDRPYWELVAIIGGVIYLMGADSACCSGHKKQPAPEAPAAEKKPEPEKNAGKGKNKKQ